MDNTNNSLFPGDFDDEDVDSEFGEEEYHQDYGRRRAKTISRKQMAREQRDLQSKGELLDIIESWHPKTRADCYKMSRPCMYVTCRHHLYLDVNQETGSVKLNFPDKEIWEMVDTCALDIAERGGATLEEVGKIMNLTRERIRQLEIRGINKLKRLTHDSDGVDTYARWDLNCIDDE